MAERELEITMKAKDQITATARKISKSVSTMGSGMKKAFAAAAKAASVAKSVIQKVVGPLLKIGSIASAIAGGAFGLMITQAADLGDQIGKLSQRFGIATETLSTLRYQAGLSGTDFETLIDTFKDLGKNIFEASNNTGTAIDTFNELGIAVKDASGKARDTNEVFLDVADVFSKMEDGNKKATLAMRIFGEAGQRIIPLLNSGKEGLKGMADEAARLGLVIDQEAAEKAEKFNNALGLLKGSLTGLKFAIGLEFFDDLAETFRKLGFWIADNREAIVGFIRDVANVAKNIAGSIAKAFSDDGERDKLIMFFSDTMTAVFSTAGEAAGVAFKNSLRGVLANVSDIFLTRNMTAKEKADLFGISRIDPQAIKDASQQIKDAYKALIGKDGSSGASGAVDAITEIEETFARLPSVMTEMTAASMPAWVQAFMDAAGQIKTEVEDIGRIMFTVTGEMTRALSDGFFAFAKRGFTDLKTFITDTFQAIVDSILKILSNMLASQVVSGFGSLLGNAFGTPASSSSTFDFFDGTGGSTPPGGSGSVFYGDLATSSSGSSAPSSFSGNTGSSGGITVNINAVDAQSVAGLLKNNGKAIADALSSALSSDNARRRQLGASLS